jgi:hypothetical protein
MLAPLSSLEAYRRDAVTIDGDGVDDATAASWLESATRLERAAAARGPERDRLLAGLLSQLGVVPFPATVVFSGSRTIFLLPFCSSCRTSRR